MKLSTVSIVFTFIALMISSVKAATNVTVNIAIRTGIIAPEQLSPAEKQKMDIAINNIGSELDAIVEDVVGDVPAPPKRNLRDNGERALRCNPCYGYPEWWAGCVVSGVYYDQCRRELALHKELSEEDIADLNEEDRHRHLMVAQLCREAKGGIASALDDAVSEGTVPVPDGTTFIEECLYEYLP
jgi:hypothetical protein